MPAFIVFEGLDGAGKTTLAKSLALYLDALLIATPPQILRDPLLRRPIDEGSCVKTSYLYYVLADSMASDMVKEARKTRFVVCDRYIHSTIVGHMIKGFNPKFDFKQFAIEEPDISFFLFVSDENERLRRLVSRGGKSRNDISSEDGDYRRKYAEYFSGRDDSYPLDTNNDTPEESLEKIKRELVRIGLIVV